MTRRVILAACLLAVTGASVFAAPASHSATKVGTSRGERELLVYRPDPPPKDEKPLVLFISGEGGWRRFDGVLSTWLSEAGYCVGGVDSMDYFWEPQDDRQALASDFRAYAAALAASAGRSADAPLVIAGFSFGADLAPWLAGAGGWGRRVLGMLMVAPDKEGSLAFRVMEILGFDQNEHVFSVASALRDAAGVPALFIHGEKDSGSYAATLARDASQANRLITIPGADHHFSGRESQLRDALVDGLKWLETQGSSSQK